MKQKVKRYQEGGEAELKKRGLEESKNERSGFLGLGRFLEGNIDKPGSVAYEKYGAGRGRAAKAKEEAAPAEDRPRARSSFGYEDMDGRMPAKSTMSGPIEDIKPKKAEPKAEAPKAKEEAKPSSVDFSKYDTESYTKPTSTSSGSTSTTGGSKSSKASDNKPKKAKFPSNPDAPKYDTSGNERRRGDSQSFAPPANNRRPTYEPTLSIEDRAKMLSDGNKATARNKKDDEDYATKKKRERAGKDARVNSAVYGMKKGGTVRTASQRADGCAIRGKTRA